MISTQYCKQIESLGRKEKENLAILYEMMDMLDLVDPELFQEYGFDPKKLPTIASVLRETEKIIVARMSGERI